MPDEAYPIKSPFLKDGLHKEITDFRPVLIPNDLPDEALAPDPKDLSAQEPVVFSDSQKQGKTEQIVSVVKDNGKPKESVNGQQTSLRETLAGSLAQTAKT